MAQAYSYIRWSSEKQTAGDSKRRQSTGADEYCQKHGLTLSSDRYLDAGVSAFRGKNAAEGALAGFLEAVDQGRVPKGSMLLIENFDRLSRSPVMTALSLFQSIVARGITIVTMSDNMVYSEESVDANWTQLIFALAKMASAHSESLEKGKKVKAAWDSKRASGEILTSVCPAWLRRDGNRFLVVTEKAEIVRRIFSLASAGNGSPTICRILNGERVPTLGGIASDWSAGLVAAVLKNRSVIGTLTPKKANADPVEGYYPPVIDEATFFLVQNQIQSRIGKGGVKGTGVANLFAGFTFCACGKRTRFVSASKPHLYLRCLSAYGNTGCDAPTYPYNAIENLLADYFVHAGQSIQGTTTGTPDNTITTRSELAEKRVRLERLLDLAETGSMGIGARITKLETEIAALEHKLRTDVPTRPVSDVVAEVWMFLDRHAELKEAGTANALTEHRLKLQAAMRQLITKLVLGKETHKAPKANGGFQYREIVLYGPIADALAPSIQAIKAEIAANPAHAKYEPFKSKVERITEDGGVVQMLELPAKGFQPGNIRGRRRRAED